MKFLHVLIPKIFVQILFNTYSITHHDESAHNQSLNRFHKPKYSNEINKKKSLMATAAMTYYIEFIFQCFFFVVVSFFFLISIRISFFMENLLNVVLRRYVFQLMNIELGVSYFQLLSFCKRFVRHRIYITELCNVS